MADQNIAWDRQPVALGVDQHLHRAHAYIQVPWAPFRLPARLRGRLVADSAGGCLQWHPLLLLTAACVCTRLHPSTAAPQCSPLQVALACTHQTLKGCETVTEAIGDVAALLQGAGGEGADQQVGAAGRVAFMVASAAMLPSAAAGPADGANAQRGTRTKQLGRYSAGPSCDHAPPPPAVRTSPCSWRSCRRRCRTCSQRGTACSCTLPRCRTSRARTRCDRDMLFWLMNQRMSRRGVPRAGECSVATSPICGFRCPACAACQQQGGRLLPM